MVFESPAGGIMFESNLLGTHPKFYRTAQKHMTVVHEIDLPISVGQEDAIWDKVVDQYDDRGYDYGAFMYFCWRSFLRKLFRIPLPMTNPWSKGDHYLCDELYRAVESVARSVDVDLSITPPHQLYELLIRDRV
jgi:hypothetical protein